MQVYDRICLSAVRLIVLVWNPSRLELLNLMFRMHHRITSGTASHADRCTSKNSKLEKSLHSTRSTFHLTQVGSQKTYSFNWVFLQVDTSLEVWRHCCVCATFYCQLVELIGRAVPKEKHIFWRFNWRASPDLLIPLAFINDVESDCIKMSLKPATLTVVTHRRCGWRCVTVEQQCLCGSCRRIISSDEASLTFLPNPFATNTACSILLKPSSGGFHR